MTINPKTYIIHGKRVTSYEEQMDNPRAMRETAQDLIEAADFQLTCLPKVVRWVQEFALVTRKDPATEAITTALTGAVQVDEESGGRVEVIEV